MDLSKIIKFKVFLAKMLIINVNKYYLFINKLYSLINMIYENMNYIMSMNLYKQNIYHVSSIFL